MKTSNSNHLTLEDRVRIETMLSEGFSARYIALRLDKSPSTISRELKKHSFVRIPRHCDCLNSSSCYCRHVCGASSCPKKCKLCSKAKKYCQDYVQVFCDSLIDHPLHLCNSCSKRKVCHFEQRFYSAASAHQQYLDTLTNSRNGFDLSAQELQLINDVVSPLVMQGQSIYHIIHSNKDSLPISDSTLRRLIQHCELDARLIDLPETVKRRQRHKSEAAPKHSASVSKSGHLYSDYLSYIQKHDVPVVQMDCIEGLKTDICSVLSLHFVPFHMQLYFILESHTASSVVSMLDRIEQALGKDLFAACFPLILTDNGSEFADITGMERSFFGGKRTSVFFCEPNRSDQKAQCECNHKLFRRIVPKGTSLDNFMQSAMAQATDHINSYIRKSLFGKCPYDLAHVSLPEDFFIFLGLEQLPPESVNLTPGLLR